MSDSFCSLSNRCKKPSHKSHGLCLVISVCISAISVCNLLALCWCERALVASCRPTWHPPASPIHLQAFLGGCLCVECSTPWSLGPNGVWERGLGFFSLCSAVQTRCCHAATPSFSAQNHCYAFISVFMSVPITICHDWQYIASTVSCSYLSISAFSLNISGSAGSKYIYTLHRE